MSTPVRTHPQVVPPPWSLSGDGTIWLFKFPREFVDRHGFMADWQRQALGATLGAVMLVDYRQTDVGPYFELLFMPGRLSLHGRGMFTISKIYVSTAASVWNGIENWGIPKEQADFARERNAAGGGDVIRASAGGRELFSARLTPYGPRFPITSALFPLRVGQALRGDLLITTPSARGSARLCRVADARVDGALFPDFTPLRPIAVLAVSDFGMTFPVPEVVPRYFSADQAHTRVSGSLDDLS